MVGNVYKSGMDPIQMEGHFKLRRQSLSATVMSLKAQARTTGVHLNIRAAPTFAVLV